MQTDVFHILIQLLSEASSSFLIMPVKPQFLKCLLCVVLYLIVCFLLLKLKESYETVQQINVSRIMKSQQHRQDNRAVRFIKKSANAEIKILAEDERNGQSISLKVSKL